MTFVRLLFIGMLVLSAGILAGCGQPTVVAVTVVRMTATRGAVTDTPVPPTQASGATPEPAGQETSAPESTPTMAGERVSLSFATSLSTVEEIDEIRDLLRGTAGILAVTGNENSVTITYDPAVLTVPDLVAKMNQIGFPVKPPEG